jgi:hypothetical protein
MHQNDTEIMVDDYDKYDEDFQSFTMKLSKSGIAAIILVILSGIAAMMISNQIMKDYAEVNGELPGDALMSSTLCLVPILLITIIWIGLIISSVVKYSTKLTEFSFFGASFIFILFQNCVIQDYRSHSSVAYQSGLPWYIYSYVFFVIAIVISLGFISSYVRKLKEPTFVQNNLELPGS